MPKCQIRAVKSQRESKKRIVELVADGQRWVRRPRRGQDAPVGRHGEERPEGVEDDDPGDGKQQRVGHERDALPGDKGPAGQLSVKQVRGIA